MHSFGTNKIMAIGAHLDDIEITCGGMLADAANNSLSVKMLVLSDSSYIYYDGRPGRVREQALQEGHQAADILGAEIEVLDFPNKDIPYNSSVIQSIEKSVNEYAPNLIITHWVHDIHPDHRNTALSTLAACRYHNNILMFEPMMPTGRSYQGFRAQLYYPVSEYGLKKKIESLKAHESEFLKYGESFYINGVTSRGIHRGFEIHADHAECFEIVRMELKIW
jgi:LmbE family N-acetylglucosaminyl deacetylase